MAGHAHVIVEGGKVTDFQTIARDITDRKLMEEALHASEERLSLVLQGANLGMWDWNIKTGEVVFNARWAEMLEYDPGEVEPHVRSWEKLIHPDDLDDVMRALNDHTAGRTPFYQTEHRLLTKSGGWKWVLDGGQVIERDVDEKPLRVTGVHLDVTDRKEAEIMAKQSADRLLSILSHLPYLLWMKDTDGVFQIVNHAFAHSCGQTSPEDVVGKTDFNVWPHDLAERYRNDDLAVMAAGEVRLVEEPIQDHGITKWFETYKTPLFASDGRVVGTVGSARDITDRKLSEAALLENARNKAVADLASGVAHNFNNLLQMVMGSAELSLKRLDLGRFDDLRQGIGRIVEACRIGAHTVQRLSRFAGPPETSGASKASEVFDLSELAAQAIEMTKPWWKTNPERMGFHIGLATDLQGGCLIGGCKDEIFHVLVNLVKNSVEALPHGGEIDIRSWTEHAMVFLRVRDTGVGIPQQDIERVFTPFFSSSVAMGRGLGLSISRKIIEEHRGSITVSSAPGAATAFTVALPLSEGLRKARRPEAPAVTPHRPLSILVVDDMEMMVEILKDTLETLGHQVLTSLSGTEGLALFRQNHIDAVICDLGMEGMNGWQVGKAILEICDTQGVAKPPFVILTGWNYQGEESEKMRESGVDFVARKPVNISELVRNIAALCASR